MRPASSPTLAIGCRINPYEYRCKKFRSTFGRCVARLPWNQPRPPRYLPDLTLYEPSLLTALRKLSVKPLEALLLDLQSTREGVEAFEGSTLKPALELALPGFSGPPQRQGRRTLLLDGLPRIEEFFGGYAKSSSQLTDGAKVRTPYLAGLDAGDRGETHTSLPSQPCLGPHSQPTDILDTLAMSGTLAPRL